MRRISRLNISIGKRLRHCIPLNVYFVQSHRDPTMPMPMPMPMPILDQKVAGYGPYRRP